MTKKIFNKEDVQGIPHDDINKLWNSVKHMDDEKERTEAFKKGLETMSTSGKYPFDFALPLLNLSNSIKNVSEFSENSLEVSIFSHMFKKKPILLTMISGHKQILFY